MPSSNTWFHRTLDLVSSDLRHRHEIRAKLRCVTIIPSNKEELLQHDIFYFLGLQFILWGVLRIAWSFDQSICQLVCFPTDLFRDMYYQSLTFLLRVGSIKRIIQNFPWELLQWQECSIVDSQEKSEHWSLEPMPLHCLQRNWKKLQ